MSDLVNAVLAEARAQSVSEAVAVALAVLYLLLAIRQNIWCWVCAGISTALFAWLYFGAGLYMEAALNVFYFAMALYGWSRWYNGGGRGRELPVTTWPLQKHVVAILVIAALSLVSGYLLDSRTDAAFPYVDSVTTWGGVWATYLVARKVLENWWYWLVIDATMVWVFWSRELELTALLFVFYLLLIPAGLVSWARSYREARA